MPELCRFRGIVIVMYAGDHDPPHFHVCCGAYKAQVHVADCSVRAGYLPAGAMRLVRRWHALHADELAVAWEKAKRHESPGTIDPLP